MLLRHGVTLLVGGVVVLTWACAPDAGRETPLSPAADAITTTYAVSGTVYGPDEEPICDASGADAVVVRLIPAEASAALASVTVTCTADGVSYSFEAPNGTYYLLVALMGGGLGSLPTRYIDPVPVVMAGASVVKNITVLAGAELLGGATLDGVFVPGIALTLTRELPVGAFARVPVVSEAGGGWRETPNGRFPAYLQAPMDYRALNVPCQVLGATPAEVTPDGVFQATTAGVQIDLAFTSNDAGDFTQQAGDLLVTSAPGDFGRLGASFCSGQGPGWGVQFPVGPSGPSHLPLTASQLYTGGLIVAVAPDIVLTGTSVSGYDLECGGTAEDQCQDFGADAVLRPWVGPRGKYVTWRYSDAASQEAQGLAVTQRSYAGGGDYVIYEFTFEYLGRGALTFWAGAWMDWDIDSEATDDVSGVALDGRLLYATNQTGGNHLGTLIMGAPVTGTYTWYNGTPQPTERQVLALSGGAGPATAGPGDIRTIHGAGPFTLRRGQVTTLRVALVAGKDEASLLAAATAALEQANRSGPGNR